MGNFSNLEAISEFAGESGITYGVYSVVFKGTPEIFIRNGNSIGVVTFFLGSPVGKCIAVTRSDVKEEFLNFLRQQEG